MILSTEIITDTILFKKPVRFINSRNFQAEKLHFCLYTSFVNPTNIGYCLLLVENLSSDFVVGTLYRRQWILFYFE